MSENKLYKIMVDLLYEATLLRVFDGFLGIAFRVTIFLSHRCSHQD